MLNQIIIMGRLTRDPELRRTQSGTAVCSFSVAVDRDFKSQSGEKETDFIDVVAWRQTGEFVSKYFTKGRMIVVSGSLQSRKWQDRNEPHFLGSHRGQRLFRRLQARQRGRHGRQLRGSGLYRSRRRIQRPCGRRSLRLCRDRRGGRRPAVLMCPQRT